jgi:HEAT repeat protein
VFMTFEDQSDEAKKRREVAPLRIEFESKTTEELFLATLDGEYDDDSPWEAVTVLQGRGTPEVFEAAKRYCASENPRARARGLSVLAQLGAGRPDAERPFMGDSVSIAVSHLRDSDPEAVRCAAWALSHLGTQQAVLSLIELRNHTDPEVRQAVACCIPLRTHPEAVSVLVALMDDGNEEVRNWATFALGSGNLEEGGALQYFDSAEIREAFRKRLDDSYEEARREAIWGLALRHDSLGVKLLLSHLESEEYWSGDKDAAEEILGLPPETSIEELCKGLRRLLA